MPDRNPDRERLPASIPGPLEYPRRRSPRLTSYDYTQSGAYFVTICTQDRVCLFGDVRDGVVHLDERGSMIVSTWNEMAHAYSGVELESCLVMPNHLHGIVWLRRPGELSLADVIQRFKSLTTARYRYEVMAGHWEPFPGKLWQRSYYEHVIRDDRDLLRVQEYILSNPSRWERRS